MNRYRFSIVADIRLTEPEQYLGVWKSKDEWFLVRAVEGFKKHYKGGKSEEWITLDGLVMSVYGGYAKDARATLERLKQGFQKVEEGPKYWTTMRTV